MRKSLLTIGLATLALSSFASTRILYRQNFENVASPEAAGWSFGGASLTIGSDKFGHFLEMALGQNNGRSGQVTWGEEVFLGEDGNLLLEDDTYTLKYDFCIKTTSNNQYNSEITVFTNHAPIANNKYRDPWSQSAENSFWQTYLFDMCQSTDSSKDAAIYAINGPTVETVNKDEEGNETVSYSVSYDDVKTLDMGSAAWYTVELNVNTSTREVEYSVTSLEGDILQEGSITVPEKNVINDLDISMFAQGLYALCARYQTTYLFDNFVISFETSYEWANAPTIALTGMGENEDGEADPRARKYTITFLPEETLHVIGTDGKLITVEYDDCEEPGNYNYITTTSGTLKAYTNVGDAVSPEAEENVECVPYVLPAVTVTTSSVKEGFGKTYTLTISNMDVPMRPDIFINYEFIGVNGEKISEEGAASGVKVTVSQEGTLTVTSEAYGYESKTITVDNDSEFSTKKVWDFARMTEEEINAKLSGAAWETLNSSTTDGFQNWTARKRLYYYSSTETKPVVDENGDVIGEEPADIYPFGFVSAESETQVVKYAVIDRSGVAETTKGQYFDGLTIFPERGKLGEGALPNVGMLYHIGLFNNQTTNNNNNVYVNDLEQTDFVVVNYINNYGGNSNHPLCSNDEEYYAQLEGEDAVYSVAASGTLNEETGLYDLVHALYRVDTAITKITIFKPVGGGSDDAVEGVEAVEGDGYWYSIDGVRVAEPTRPGLYIHNGKKYILK